MLLSQNLQGSGCSNLKKPSVGHWEGYGNFLEQHISLNFPSSVGLEFSTGNIHTT